MLELTTLVFKVNSEQLVQAKKHTDDLAVAQKGLATAMQKQSAAGSSNPKAATESKKQVDLVTKLNNLYGDLAAGASRWEASQLRAARQTGADLDAVGKKLLDIRDLMPGSSFDPAIGAVRKIRQEFDSLTNRVELTKQGIILTKGELEAFGRIPFETKGKMQSKGLKPEGADSAEFSASVAASQADFINRAKGVSVLRTAEKERLEIVKQTSAAEKFLVAEMQRMDAVLGEMNSEYGLNVRTQQLAAEATAKYAMNLKRAGIEGAEAARRMEEYRKKVSQVADIDKKRAGERLSNALAPQISDVAVSIAGGMPLHLVMMQQGLQIRDLIGQSKVDVQDLQKVFRESMSKMVTSIGGTITALGSMAFGGLVDAGRAVNSFAGNITGLNATTSALSARLPALAGGIAAVGAAMNVVAGLGIGLLIAGIAAVTYEFVKLIGANNDLARTLAVTGGVFGVTQKQSAGYVDSLTKVGATTREAIDIIGLMANSGKLSASQLEMVGKAAVDMEKYAGVAIKDTVSAFNEMAKDPVKALTELAIKTGDVSPKTLQLAYDLQEQGKMADASRIAVEALAAQHSKAVNRMKEDLHPLTAMWIELKKVVSGAWTFIGNTINKGLGVGSELQKTKDAIENIKSIQDGSGGLLTKLAPKDYMKEELLSLQKKLVMMDKVAQIESDAQVSASERSSQIKKNEENEINFMGKKEKARRELLKLEQAYNLSNKLAGGGKGFGEISHESYLEKKKELEDQLKDKNTEGTKQATYGLNIQEKINDAYNQMIGKVRELNALEKLLLDIRDDPRYAKMSKSEKAATEQKIKDLKQQAQVEISTKETLIQAEKDAELIRKEQKKSEEDIAELYRELTLHGEKYEKTLLDINKARDLGVIKTDAEAERLRKENLLKNSNASKYFKKEEKDSNKVDRDLDYAEEDMLLRQLELSRTDRVNQLARSEFETKKSLAKEYSEFYLKETEILDSVEGQQQADLLTALLEQHERKKGLIIAEGELKKRVLSEEQERQKNFDGLVRKGFESMGDALVDFALTGKASFGDMVKQMLIDLARLEIKMQMMKLYDGLGGGSGILKAIGDFLPFANGGAFDSGVQKFAKGGSFTNSVVTRPTRFNMGEMGEAGPEAIVPLKRGRDGALGIASSGGGSSVQVVINNHSGSQVAQKETTDSRGNRRVEVTIGDMTAGEMSRTGSSVQNSVSNTFGMKPALLPR